MKIIILIILLVFLGKNSFLLSQEEIEYTSFEHRALFLKVKYPTEWKNYWFYDGYNEKNISDMSFNEIKEMVIHYGYYPILYIRKYVERYNGVNPSIRISLLPQIIDYSYRDLLLALYNFEYKNIILYSETIYRRIEVITTILLKGRTITQEINIQYIGNKPFLHFKTEDYVLDSNIVNDNFYRITEYYLFIEDNYIMVIETNYGRTININDYIELNEIINNIRLE